MWEESRDSPGLAGMDKRSNNKNINQKQKEEDNV